MRCQSGALLLLSALLLISNGVHGLSFSCLSRRSAVVGSAATLVLLPGCVTAEDPVVLTEEQMRERVRKKQVGIASILYGLHDVPTLSAKRFPSGHDVLQECLFLI